MSNVLPGAVYRPRRCLHMSHLRHLFGIDRWVVECAGAGVRRAVRGVHRVIREAFDLIVPISQALQRVRALRCLPARPESEGKPEEMERFTKTYCPGAGGHIRVHGRAQAETLFFIDHANTLWDFVFRQKRKTARPRTPGLHVLLRWLFPLVPPKRLFLVRLPSADGRKCC